MIYNYKYMYICNMYIYIYMAESYELGRIPRIPTMTPQTSQRDQHDLSTYYMYIYIYMYVYIYIYVYIYALYGYTGLSYYVGIMWDRDFALKSETMRKKWDASSSVPIMR